MAEQTSKSIVGYGALGAVALAAIIGLFFLSSKPQLQPTPPAPPPPAAVKPAITPPSFDAVRVDSNGSMVLAGHGAPGSQISVKSGDTLVGTATADAQGGFVITPNSPLPAGPQQLSLSETLPDGTAVAGDSTASVNVANGSGNALAVVSGPNGSTVLSGQGPKPFTLGMGAVDYDANGHAIFSGNAPANAKIALSLDGKPLGTATADADGHWRFTATVPANSGMLSLSGTDASGGVLPAVTSPFALETLPNALAAGHVVITPGNNLWVIARNVYGHGNLYTLIYSANASQIHDPNLIFPGQSFALPVAKPQ